MEQSEKPLARLIEERKEKLNSIREAGIEPFPQIFNRSNTCAELQAAQEKLKNGEETQENAVVAGRIRSIRSMGRIGFIDLEDSSGKIQLYLQEDSLGKDKYKLLKKLDMGDFIGASGFIFRTNKGELSIHVKQLTPLCKTLRPLPSNWYGLKDTEVRYRQRYLDLIMNPEVKQRFIMRSRAMTLMREYMEKEGYLEVETPLLQPVYGGANARPFTTHLKALDMKLYLSISPELYLKRLIIGGYDKVYTICKNFRNEGVDRSHNPEFTMMESYAAYQDYNDMMKLTENLYNYIFEKINGTTKVEYEGEKLDFKAPWKRLTMYDAIKEYTGINVAKASKEEMLKELKSKGLRVEGAEELDRGRLVMAIFDEHVSGKIMQPTFIIDHPKESSPLCKVHRKDPELIERFEPFAYGYELGNAYSELNDPIRQRELFEEQMKRMQAGDEEAHPLDADFLEAMEYGMPPTGGLGLGFDRMIMFLTAQHTIRDVILFPFMRKQE